MAKIRYCTTPQLIELAKAAKGNNRSVNVDLLKAQIDPEGKHTLAMQFVHNGEELRTWWHVKIKDSDSPRDVWLDVPFESFATHTLVHQHDMD